MHLLCVTLIFFFSSRYTSPVQCWTHALPWSFRASKSSKVHGSGRRGQIRRCSIVCSSPQSQVASPSSYCNGLMYGLPDNQLKKLQVIQNAAARLVTRTKKFESISPILRALHWLPIRSRIAFKILLLTYQCFHEMAPS